MTAHSTNLADAALAEEIAARYGAGVSPGLTVSKVPRGVSGLPQEQWCEKRNGIYPVEPIERSRKFTFGSPGKNIATLKAKAEKANAAARIVVAEAHAQGMTTAQIAERHGLDPRRIRTAYKALGLKPILPPPANKKPKHSTETVEKIRECAAMGMTIVQTAERLAIKKGVVEYLRDVHKIKTAVTRKPSEPKKPRPVKVTFADAHHAEIMEMVEAGNSGKAIARHFGVAQSTINKHLRKVGLDTRKDIAAQQERRAKIKAMIAEGKTPSLREAAKMFDISISTAHKDIAAAKAESHE